ncbi:hypothetical protein [Salipaludibacillus neizhouensis]|uniref:hypothetical protein n=1 Tax=Salipaludibacillus neizhouensis TaxID=885475 RepID=UPI0015FF290B|nr:hypothetical protein [Salipaludibacillus neizhouensis]
MSALSKHIAEAHTKTITLELGRLLTQKEKDFIYWFSKKQSLEDFQKANRET